MLDIFMVHIYEKFTRNKINDIEEKTKEKMTIKKK